MSDDIQLQKAIYDSFRSSSSSASRSASSGGGGSFGRSFRSSAPSSSSSYLRNSPRHVTRAAGASGGGGGSKSKPRSSALRKEGILPARKSGGARSGGGQPPPSRTPAVTTSSASAAGGDGAPRPKNESSGGASSAVLDSLHRRFGGAVSVGGGGHGACGGTGTGAAASSRWRKLAGVGTFTWAKGTAGTRGTLDSTGNASGKEPCIIAYHPARDDDPKGWSTLQQEPPREQLAQHSVALGALLKFQCSHAAPASGQVPKFHLLCFRKGAAAMGGAAGNSQCVALSVDTKERVFALELVELKTDEELHTRWVRVRTLHTAACRDLRPGVRNTLRFHCQQQPGGAVELTIACNDGPLVADKVSIADEWFTCDDSSSSSIGGGDRVRPMLGLSVSRSRLDWEDLELAEGQVGARSGGASVGRFVHADMALVQLIEEEMLEIESPVTFDDIASLDGAKQLLNEAVTLPLVIPEFFVGIREPWKGVLLFGPPGTGKTLLARAIASMSGIRFFNCSSSTMTSKFRGESEKICKLVFQMARHYAPSIVFFDEVDAQVSQRGMEGEHEASRRFKSELLSQMDGITSTSGHGAQGPAEGKNVIVLATTNCPWDVDEAMRRRLEKRIYIPLPDAEARKAMFAIYLGSVSLAECVDVAKLVAATDGFSGADIKLLCRDASMMPMRRAIFNKSPEDILKMKQAGLLQSDKQPLLQSDFEGALAKIQPSVSPHAVDKYEQWNKDFAST